MSADERPVCSLCHRPAEYRVLCIIDPLTCQTHLGMTLRSLTQGGYVATVERLS